MTSTMTALYEGGVSWVRSLFSPRKSPSPAKIIVNPKLSDFDQIKTIGKGTYGHVVLVKHKESGTFCALKILRKEKMVRNAKDVKHIINERKILEKLDHPFIVGMYGSFKDNVYLYLILEFVNGGDLFFHLKSFIRFNECHARFYIAQIVLALEYLHSLNIIYRDLKPENVLLDRSGYIKLTDLGFATYTSDKAWSHCGTHEYMAPEIVLGYGYGKAVDWWALGVLTYEFCAGDFPFRASSLTEMFQKVCRGKVSFPTEFSSQLRSFLKRLLEVNPLNRLGNTPNGVYDLKKHQWIAMTNWEELYEKKTRAYFIPECKGRGDPTNFDEYKDLEIRDAEEDQFAYEFADF
ncbi:hypothetical protein L596_010086 [Steinernema carpocapsae]|uniref:cAMP-dependent protein kinase n=1 Tax=Steinernema carpocapsae TaxID=34508 RepID=A0A4U5PHS2_STECR|nr:hypothetical protein L596_010086 [Steinernema carpocapsae]